MTFYTLVFDKNYEKISKAMADNARYFDLNAQHWHSNHTSWGLIDCTSIDDLAGTNDVYLSSKVEQAAQIIWDGRLYDAGGYSDEAWLEVIENAFKHSDDHGFDLNRVAIFSCER